ncbi:MAG: LrgB family protein [Sutterella sp.]|nr:LrgB family protein [Sutterella sp.]
MLNLIGSVYSHLENNPALWLALTLIFYAAGQHVFRLSKGNPLLSPIIIAVVCLIATLLVFGIPYERYFEGASLIHFLLGPATVALAVPLFEQRSKLAQLWLPLTVGLLAGCISAIISVVVLGWVFGLSSETLISMIPKSVTTPIAMGVSEAMGGMPDLTACFVVITGILGSIIGRPLFNLLRIHSDPVRGVSLGLNAHGMGTSAAFLISNRAGAFSGLAMGLAGILTAFLAPMLGGPLMRLFGL